MEIRVDFTFAAQRPRPVRSLLIVGWHQSGRPLASNRESCRNLFREVTPQTGSASHRGGRWPRAILSTQRCSGKKIIFIAAKETEVDECTFATAIRQAFGVGSTTLRGVRQICLNWTTSTSVRQRLLHEETPPSVLIGLWVETIEKARLEDVGRRLTAVAVKQSAYEIDPHVALG